MELDVNSSGVVKHESDGFSSVGEKVIWTETTKNWAVIAFLAEQDEVRGAVGSVGFHVYVVHSQPDAILTHPGQSATAWIGDEVQGAARSVER